MPKPFLLSHKLLRSYSHDERYVFRCLKKFNCNQKYQCKLFLHWVRSDKILSKSGPLVTKRPTSFKILETESFLSKFSFLYSYSGFNFCLMVTDLVSDHLINWENLVERKLSSSKIKLKFLFWFWGFFQTSLNRFSAPTGEFFCWYVLNCQFWDNLSEGKFITQSLLVFATHGQFLLSVIICAFKNIRC